MSLGEKYTIPPRSGFDKVFLKPDIKLKEGGFILLGKKNYFNNPRLGVSIKKNDYRLAVHRNFLKRKIRSSFQNFVCRLPLCDFIVIAVGRENHISKKEKIDKSLDLLWKRCIENEQ
tara:strand:+ start:354 stop:704 length:351 start_codon:yes stop_codon:yes gene_type:complete